MPFVAPFAGSVRRRLLVALLAVVPSSVLGSEALAAIALIQHAGRDAGTTTSSTLAFPSANTAGNFIAVAIRAGQTGQDITVSDTRGNTYRRAAQVDLTLDGVTLGLYYAENIAGGANTVAVSDTLTGGSLRFAIFEYLGIATASSLDGTPLFAEGTSTSAETPPLTTGANGDLILGMLSTADSTTHTAGTGFVMQERVPSMGTKLSVEDQIQASAGSITATGSFGSSQSWAALVAAFTAGPSGAATVGQWSAVQNWPVVAVHASLLPTGKVLVWTDYTINNGAQVWTPGTGNFTPKNYATTSLFCSGHAFLPDGRLLIAGGIVGLSDSVGPRESTFFDPVTETFSPGPLMSQGRYYPSTTTLPDGRVLVMAGVTTCGTCIADRPEVYDPATNTWTDMADSARTTIRFYPHNYVLPDGRVLAAAHGDVAAPTTVLDLTTQTWSTVDSRITDAHSSAMYLPGKVVKCGTATQDNEGHPAAATTYVLDMTQPSPQWQAVAPMAFPRSFHNMTVLPDGQVLVTGGSTTTDRANYAAAVYAAELWSPTTQTWSTMSFAASPRLYHSTALLLPDATVLVAGGGRRNGRSQPDPQDQQNAEIFSPPYLFKGPRPSISSAPGLLTYGTSFTVDTPDASRIARVSLIALGSVTHAFNENQRFVPLTFTAGTSSLTVQAPASGNIAPPGPYMLFLVDDVGVPSLATMVRVAADPGIVAAGKTSGVALTKSTGLDLTLSWTASCSAADSDFEVYEGTLGNFQSRAPLSCSTGGALSWTFSPGSGDTYYLVVPRLTTTEGSYGHDSAGQRASGSSACLPQAIAPCALLP
jgi:hypothetical protein